MFLQLLSFLGVALGFLFLVLAIASGLYYISELVEEHTEPTKRLLKKVIYLIMGMFVLLLIFDNFPFKLSAFSIFSYYIYLLNLVKFPYVKFTSPVFISSCILVIFNHFLWFDYFHNPQIPSIEERLKPGYEPPRLPTFFEIGSFFGLCIWFVPFALFVSLSAHENLLPHYMENTQERKKNNGLAKVLVVKLRELFYSLGRKLGYDINSQKDRIV